MHRFRSHAYFHVSSHLLPSLFVVAWYWQFCCPSNLLRLQTVTYSLFCIVTWSPKKVHRLHWQKWRDFYHRYKLSKLYYIYILKSQLQTSDPFKEPGCGREDCLVCTTFGQGNCNTESITYRIDCSVEGCEKDVYKGETAFNAYTRGREHMGRLAARDLNNSPLWRHCMEQHGGEEQNFWMSVTGTYRNDAMLRQITEAVQINGMEVSRRMNDRAEWNMTRIPRTVITTEG